MEFFDLVSYRDFYGDHLEKTIASIGNDFEGWENYNSDEPQSLKTLLATNQRFVNGDYTIVMNRGRPVAAAGYHPYKDDMLILTRAYTWPEHRPSKFISNKILPYHILQSIGHANKCWMYVNEHNRRIFELLQKNGASGVAGQTNKHHLYEHFVFQDEPQMVYGVKQYLASIDLNDPDIYNWF